MPDPVITLTTDFGAGSPYVAAMKGVVLGINPWARLLDLTHTIPPQDLLQTDYFLRNVLACYPPGSLHVIVVDPGVGTERALLYVEVGGHRLLVPDNGCWTGLEGASSARVRRLTEPRFWRQPVSATFHGRDILAPVAAHLSLGIDPAELGPEVSDWVVLETPGPTRGFHRGKIALLGQVQHIDCFGNLITNLSARNVHLFSQEPADPSASPERRRKQQHDWPSLLRVVVGDAPVSGYVRTYANADPGSLVFLFSSDSFLEVAEVQGSAARRLEAEVGTLVAVTLNAGR